MKETWQVWSLLHRKYIELVEANMRQDVGREKLSHFVKTLEFMIRLLSFQFEGPQRCVWDASGSGVVNHQHLWWG